MNDAAPREGGSAIAGVGETPLGRDPGRTAVDLQTEAILLALADAGLTAGDVDALFALGPYSAPSMMFATTLAEYAGLQPRVEATVDAGGTYTPMMMLANAAQAIDSGSAHVAVCAFGEAAASGLVRPGRGWTSTEEPIEFEAPWGIVGPVASYALVASRRMAEVGTTMDDLGAIAVAHREHALRHPNAFRRKPMTLDEYRESPMIATPLRRLDCSTMVDGAGALVVTSAERARDLPWPAVEVLSISARNSHRNVLPFPGFEELGIGAVAERGLARAGVTLGDIDVAFIHDAFTISVAVYLEELGFCGRGEVGDYVRGGGIGLGSACPVNTHGGLLSQGHVGGILHVVEAVQQLRGDADERQVSGCRHALVVGGGGILGVNATMVLGVA